MNHDSQSTPDRAEPISSPTPGPRPRSASLLLFATVLLTLAYALAAARSLWKIISRLEELPSYWGALLYVGWSLGLLGVLVAAAVGIRDRKRWARWLGLLVLGLLAFVFFTLVPDTTDYQTEAQRAGGRTFRVVAITLLFVFWGYAFAFSAKAKRYFD